MPKKDMRQLMKKSPDRSDALALTFYDYQSDTDYSDNTQVSKSTMNNLHSAI